MSCPPLRLVIFDVDGTLVDSQGAIVDAMAVAFRTMGLPVPARAAILSIVGLSLERAMAHLAPNEDAETCQGLVEAYKRAYQTGREAAGATQISPLYPGARRTIAALTAVPDILLGVATGKSQRGLAALLDGHGLDGVFVTRQVADHHPSKPHPSMIHAAMAEAGVRPQDTVMIGDTSFDMEMAAAAGVAGIGVTWGYHPPERLGAARCLIDGFDQLHTTLSDIWKVTA
ncbi:HAD-IA family hydrolase [Sedimentitalea sp. HM32M-2]|uniref:HAD-IA family hydrolase n=1 Tax=Sedimentitalea sp. HM32M-2 TaxID=3351566 RepID=UPI003635FA4B